MIFNDFMEAIEFVFEFDLINDAKFVFESLRPEIKNNIPHVKIDASLSGKKIFLNLSAKNISSLRAACNSYLRWIKTALEVIKIKTAN